VTAPAFPEVDHPCITPMGFTDRALQTIFFIRNGNNVNVVGHQAIRSNLYTMTIAPFGHQVNIGS
jgi:hypothetical protein